MTTRFDRINSPNVASLACFRDEAEARRYLEKVLWPKGAVCPHCGGAKTARRGAVAIWRCHACRRDFSLRAGTVFAGSHLPLHVWLYAAFLFDGAGGDISSARLAKELGLRQPTAWKILARLRNAERDEIGRLLAGISPAPESFFNPNRKSKGARMAVTRQELAGRIYDGIKDGTLPQGDKLPPEREIAARFGTSRGAVRESLIVLETLGFIEVRGKEGVFVRSLSEEECNRSLDVYSTWPTEMLPHTFQVRLLLESEAAGLAAVNRTDADIERMKFCIDGFARICREVPEDWNRQGSRLNDLFHRLVIEAAHNPVLLRIQEGLLRIIQRAYLPFGADTMITPLEQWEERVVRGHRIILDAIVARDETTARDVMRRHLEITFGKLDALYQEHVKGILQGLRA